VLPLIISSTLCAIGQADSTSAHRVRAVLISSESSVRSSLGNRDSYLIRIVPANGRPFLARMIDNYPSYADTFPRYLQAPGSSFSIELRRAAFCDQTSKTHEVSGEYTPTSVDVS
jgi:hypothetical protein